MKRISPPASHHTSHCLPVIRARHCQTPLHFPLRKKMTFWAVQTSQLWNGSEFPEKWNMMNDLSVLWQVSRRCNICMIIRLYLTRADLYVWHNWNIWLCAAFFVLFCFLLFPYVYFIHVMFFFYFLFLLMCFFHLFFHLFMKIFF